MHICEWHSEAQNIGVLRVHISLFFFFHSFFVDSWARVSWVNLHHYQLFAARLCLSWTHQISTQIMKMFRYSTTDTVTFSVFSWVRFFPFILLSFTKTKDEKCLQSCHLICQQNLPTCCNCSAVYSGRVRNDQRDCLCHNENTSYSMLTSSLL